MTRTLINSSMHTPDDRSRISSIVVLVHPVRSSLRFISANTSHSKRSITAQTCKSHDQHFVNAGLNVTTLGSMTRTFSSHITQLTGDKIKKSPPSPVEDSHHLSSRSTSLGSIGAIIARQKSSATCMSKRSRN